MCKACVRLFPISHSSPRTPPKRHRPAPAAGVGTRAPEHWTGAGLVGNYYWAQLETTSPRLPGGRRGPGSPVPHPPPTPWSAVPAASGRGHLAFLGPGAPPFPGATGSRLLYAGAGGGVKGGWGVSPRFLGVHARAAGRLWSPPCPWSRRGD